MRRLRLALSLIVLAPSLAAASSVVVAVDTSRSLQQREVALVRERLAATLELLPAGTSTGLVAFDDRTRWLAPLGSSPRQVVAALDGLAPAGSFTLLHDALFVAASATGPPEAAATSASPDATETAVPAVTGAPSWQRPAMLAAAVIAVAALAALLWMAAARRRRADVRRCEVCGAELEPWEAGCTQCAARRAAEAVAQVDETVVERPVPPAPDVPLDDDAASTQPVAEEAVSAESLLDPAVFAKAPLPDDLDRTVALDEQPVLVARQPGQPTRTYVLPTEQVFAVGRAPRVNTLLVSDPTVSGQHFKLVPKDGDYYVVDLQTTNGTTVNGRPVRAAKLTPGDVIRIGTLEFVYEMKLQRVG